ncbi:ABC transporter A family protein [Rhynchospora pubera]|uniref:ABC transporter A family protein n=1 Tax=Rhynchospora pubera TaxID=906938 RepID=A0AAV8DMD3_9POAL|nr:ABC transporter A family protein [Rhynchospora pubera]
MGYMWRVRLSSFLVGAATASVGGLCLLYRDYTVAHDSISSQLKGISETFTERHEGLNQQIAALEKLQKANASKPEKSD